MSLGAIHWRNVALIFQREFRDQLRDRRTLFMVAVLPLVLYPMLGIGMVQMTVTFSEQTRTVLMLGAPDLPPPELIRDDRLLAKYFETPGDAEKLRVLSDLPRAAGAPAYSEAEVTLLEAARERLPALRALGAAVRRQREAERLGQAEEAAAAEREVETLRAPIAAWFESLPAQVLVVIPEGCDAAVADISARLASGGATPESLALPEHPIVLQNSANEKSAIAFRRVQGALAAWESDVLLGRLEQARLPATLPTPIDPTPVDLARTEEIAANLWSKLFPALLVIMAVTGAFHPAIDLGAGEKERGTMETLLISPASRPEIVVGKFLTVLVFSLSTALLNLASMGYTGRHMLSLRAGELSTLGDLSFPPAASLLWVFLLAIPVAALFSAVSLAVALFARSSKEGQYYLTPLLMITMGLMMFCLNPGVEITPFYSILPITGPALLLKALLLGAAPNGPMPFYVAAVAVSSLLYSGLALWAAIELFQREDVLFREAERFNMRVWLRHLLREKEALPSISEAAFCFLLILLLQFGSFNIMREEYLGASTDANKMRLQMIYLLSTVGTPALLMAVLLTRDPRRSLKLYGCSLRWLGLAVVLAVVLQPLALELLARLKWFFPPLPPGAAELMGAMGSRDLPWWLPMLALAVAPAVCEELAFRGFILSGLQRTQRYRLACVLSSLAFGVVHMIPQQVFNATLLGLVLGSLALRSGSLLPCVLFHVVFNGTQVLLSRIDPQVLQWAADRGWWTLSSGPDGVEMRFGWPVLLVCAGIAVPLLVRLVRGPVAPGWRAHAPDSHAPGADTPAAAPNGPSLVA